MRTASRTWHEIIRGNVMNDASNDSHVIYGRKKSMLNGWIIANLLKGLDFVKIRSNSPAVSVKTLNGGLSGKIKYSSNSGYPKMNGCAFNPRFYFIITGKFEVCIENPNKPRVASVVQCEKEIPPNSFE